MFEFCIKYECTINTYMCIDSGDRIFEFMFKDYALKYTVSITDLIEMSHATIEEQMLMDIESSLLSEKGQYKWKQYKKLKIN